MKRGLSYALSTCIADSGRGDRLLWSQLSYVKVRMREISSTEHMAYGRV